MRLLTADHVSRTHTTGGAQVRAVVDVSLTLDRGDFVALMGPSGCGKSTLLHLCGAMDRPTSGTVQLETAVLSALPDEALTRIRRERVGFVFQFFNLLPTLTLLENVALPLLLSGVSATVAEGSARRLLDRVGLGPRLRHFPQQLSGGELQRGAVARALVHHPALVVADEPTGNLDSDNGARILDLLVEFNREDGVTMLLATHAEEIAVGRAPDRADARRPHRVGRGKAGACACLAGSSCDGSFHEPLRSITTALGIALGVGVIVAIQLTNASSLAGFQTALDTVSGRASLEIVGTGLGVDERRLPELGWLREYGDVAPIIEGDAVLRQSGHPSERMRVLGIDILRDRPFREYRLLESTAAAGELRPQEFLALLVDPGSVILAADSPAPRGLTVGSTLSVNVGDRAVPLTVRGLLRDEGPARVLDGHFVLMDIASAQQALDRFGRVDRIEVRLRRHGR